MATLRHLGPGLYQTPDGHYNVERQDGESMCDHPLCDVLHRKYHTSTNDGRSWAHWTTYVAWHVWDNERDDYLGGGGVTEYDTKRAAEQALDRYLADHSDAADLIADIQCANPRG